jgi:DNA-binding MarR family transcriptional regulator
MDTDQDDVAELAARLRPALLRLVRVIRNQRVDLSLTLGQLSALSTIEKYGPVSPREIASLERVQPPSMTKVLASLEEQGFVRREPHPTDGRQALIAVSAKGQSWLDAERTERDRWLNKRLAMLDPEEREILLSAAPLIDKLAEL